MVANGKALSNRQIANLIHGTINCQQLLKGPNNITIMYLLFLTAALDHMPKITSLTNH